MIHFDSARWGRVREAHRRFWAGTLDRPLAGAAVREHAPAGPPPAAPLLAQDNCHDFSFSPDQLLDAIEYEVSQYEFYGDAFPYFKMDVFGPGVAAAFLGAALDNTSGRVWFRPQREYTLADLPLAYDPDNPWLRRVKEICARARDRFAGKILFSMPDLGGVLDMASTFFPGEQLHYLLCDDPEGLLPLLRQLDGLWLRFYNEISAAIGQGQYGYTDWSGIFSDTPSYILQCDFAYMISPEMFETFALPSLRAHAQALPHTVYHLDGKGQLPHLDLLLAMPELDAIQWIPGAGSPPTDHWPDVYQRILRAGKRVSLQWSTPGEVERTLAQASQGAGFHHPTLHFEKEDKEEALGFLRRIGVPLYE